MAGSQVQDSQAQALIQFTGYYSLSANDGSFVMVDTNSTWLANGDIQYAAAITISSDGQTSQKYTLGQNCTYNDGQLLITDAGGATIAQLFFNPNVGGSEISGTIGGVAVAGTTPFGPVPLEVWAGTYYRQGEPVMPIQPPQYPYTAMMQIDADGTILFAADGGPLQPVSSYWYDYGMFVISLAPSDLPYLFEMGTSSGWGRVAGNATDGSMLVNIRLQEPVPHL